MKLPVCISMRQMQQHVRQQIYLQAHGAEDVTGEPKLPKNDSADERDPQSQDAPEGVREASGNQS